MKIELISITQDAERLIEHAARTCYGSEMAKDYAVTQAFIRGLIKKGHESVLEHAVASFRVSGVSRALLAQITRHRHASFSVRSQRYTNDARILTNFPKLEVYKEAEKDIENLIDAILNQYNVLIEYGMKPEDARMILPMATATEFVMTANFREWRHIFKLRISSKAQKEVRDMCKEMMYILEIHAPSVFNQNEYEVLTNGN